MLLLFQQVINVAPDCVMLKLSIHVLSAIPILLAAASQGFSTIDSHDVTRDLPPTIVIQIQIND